jgi:hypothetical protein
MRNGEIAAATVAAASSAAIMLRIFLRKSLPLIGQIVLRKDSGDGTHRHACATVDTFHWINEELRRLFKAALILARVDAVNGAGVHACCVLHTDAWFRDYVCHKCALLNQTAAPEMGSAVTTVTDLQGGRKYGVRAGQCHPKEGRNDD